MDYTKFAEIISETPFKVLSDDQQRAFYHNSIEKIVLYRPEIIHAENRDLLFRLFNHYNDLDKIEYHLVERDFSLLLAYCQIIPSHIQNDVPLFLMPHCHRLIMHSKEVEVYFLCISLAHFANEIPRFTDDDFRFFVTHTLPFVEEGLNDYDHPWAFLLFLRKHPLFIFKHKKFIEYILVSLKKHINKRITVTDIITECIDPVLNQLIQADLLTDDRAHDTIDGFLSLISDLNEELQSHKGEHSSLLTAGIRHLVEANVSLIHGGRYEELHEAAEFLILQLRHLFTRSNKNINQQLSEVSETLYLDNGYSLEKYTPQEIYDRLLSSL